MGSSIAYTWNDGSVPPPYHAEFQLVLGPCSTGRLECRPDYVGNSPPVWTWTFDIPPHAIDDLAAELTNGCAVPAEATPIRGSPAVSVGGAHGVIEVRCEERLIAQEPTEASANSLKSAIPADIWADLQQRRSEYIRQRLRDQYPAG